MNEIERLRNQIDSIDYEILNLLAKRRDCAVKIGHLKDRLRSSPSSKGIGAYDPVRETEIIEKLKSTGAGFPANGIEAVFREIISLCRNTAHRASVFLLCDSMELKYTALEVLGHCCEYFNCLTQTEFLEKLMENEFNIGFLYEADTSEYALQTLSQSGFAVKTSFMVSDKTDGSLKKVNLIAHD